MIHHMETCKESNQRKMINSNVDDDEEEKIELFFALINNIRVARDRLMNGSNVSKGSEIHESVSTKKNKRKVVEGDEEEKTTAGVWKPTFQPEDLTEVATQSKIPHVISGGSKREHCKKATNCPPRAQSRVGSQTSSLQISEPNQTKSIQAHAPLHCDVLLHLLAVSISQKSSTSSSKTNGLLR